MKFSKEFFQENLPEWIEKSIKFSKNIFQQNFLVGFPENAVKNFVAGVNAIAQKTQEDEQYWEEGGIRIQENSPKSGGREET